MGSRGDYSPGLSKGKDGAEEAPCKACSAFNAWAKKQATDSKGPQDQLKNCPLDREGLGNATWGFLHSMAAYYPDEPSKAERCKMKSFFRSFSMFYPCKDCAAHFRSDLERIPPDVESNDSLSQWLCRMHNNVNRRIGKPIFDCSRVKERWKDGPTDGSCDPPDPTIKDNTDSKDNKDTK